MSPLRRRGGGENRPHLVALAPAAIRTLLANEELACPARIRTRFVRLAHKWDRSEEKLYAVKVRSRFALLASHAQVRAGIPEAAEE